MSTLEPTPTQVPRPPYARVDFNPRPESTRDLGFGDGTSVAASGVYRGFQELNKTTAKKQYRFLGVRKHFIKKDAGLSTEFCGLVSTLID